MVYFTPDGIATTFNLRGKVLVYATHLPIYRLIEQVYGEFWSANLEDMEKISGLDRKIFEKEFEMARETIARRTGGKLVTPKKKWDDIFGASIKYEADAEEDCKDTARKNGWDLINAGVGKNPEDCAVMIKMVLNAYMTTYYHYLKPIMPMPEMSNLHKA